MWNRTGVVVMELKALPALSESIDLDEVPLLTNEPGVPVVYTSGIADVEVDGPNVVITYYRYRGEGTSRVRVPVLEVIRPLAMCEDGIVARILDRKRKKAALSH